MNELIALLQSKKLKIEILDHNKTAVLFTLDVMAKPGARVEKVFTQESGELVIQTRKRPVEGEANSAIIEKVAEVFGVSKSSVELVRGEKSKQKKLKVLLELSLNKNIPYFINKLSAISAQSASDLGSS